MCVCISFLFKSFDNENKSFKLKTNTKSRPIITKVKTIGKKNKLKGLEILFIVFVPLASAFHLEYSCFYFWISNAYRYFTGISSNNWAKLLNSII